MRTTSSLCAMTIMTIMTSVTHCGRSPDPKIHIARCQAFAGAPDSHRHMATNMVEWKVGGGADSLGTPRTSKHPRTHWVTSSDSEGVACSTFDFHRRPQSKWTETVYAQHLDTLSIPQYKYLQISTLHIWGIYGAYMGHIARSGTLHDHRQSPFFQ